MLKKSLMRKVIMLLCCLITGTILFAQTRQLTGVLYEANTKNPVMSATITVKGKNTSTVTDADGRFSLTVPQGKVTLLVSSIGYETKEVPLNSGDNNVTVMLAATSADLQDVVVTALGIRKEKKALGYALTEVKGAELTEARSNNFMNNLVGKVPGLNVVSTATGAGGSSRVILRGNTSISGNNQPLYVVDGIPIDNSNRGSAGEWGGRDAGDGIQMLNPDEIEIGFGIKRR